MNISERLNQLIELNNLTIKDFAERSEIPYRSMYNYVRSEREPNLDAIVKLQEKWNINLNWLINGQGDMKLQENIAPTITEIERQLLVAFRNCNEGTKRKICLAVNAIASDKKE